MCQACSNERCEDCENIIDANGNCACRPDGYTKPGRTAFLYVNAYEVMRHYGGPEEGGWWYDSFNPLASIPVLAISIEGHDDSCYTCYCARQAATDPTPESNCSIVKPKYCKWGFQLIAKDKAQVEMFKKHLEECYGNLREGSIGSVLGGTDVQVFVESRPGKYKPEHKPRYE